MIWLACGLNWSQSRGKAGCKRAPALTGASLLRGFNPIIRFVHHPSGIGVKCLIGGGFIVEREWRVLLVICPRLVIVASSIRWRGFKAWDCKPPVMVSR
jgi:hypothetical protein